MNFLTTVFLALSLEKVFEDSSSDHYAKAVRLVVLTSSCLCFVGCFVFAFSFKFKIKNNLFACN